MPSVIRAGLRSRWSFFLLLAASPGALAFARASDAALRLAALGALLVWWLGALVLSPRPRALWRSRPLGFARRDAPVLLALGAAMAVCAASLAWILPQAARLPEPWRASFRGLAAGGAAMMGQGAAVLLLPWLPGSRRGGLAGVVVAAALLVAVLRG